MKSRRSRIDVIRDILASVQDRQMIKPTHLLYKSNLSYPKMKEYISELKEKNLIIETYHKNNRVFVITEQGNRFLAELRRIKSFTESFGI